MAGHRFRVFVTGESRRSALALDHLRALCEERLVDGYDIEVVDVLEQPDEADQARVMATPTVIRVVPPPSRRVVGDLSDLEAAARALDLPQRRAPRPGTPA